MAQHEVLAACMGYGGGLIENGEDGFKVSSHCYVSDSKTGILSPTEAETINRVTRLGNVVRNVRKLAEGKVNPPSLYRRALQRSLRELLQQYGDEVCEVEAEMTLDPALGITFIQSRLRLWYNLLRAAYVTGNACISADKGTVMLRELHKAAGCGSGDVQKILLRLLWHCHQVLIRQVSAWCMHGTLLDPFRELFIERVLLPAGEQKKQKEQNQEEANWDEEFILSHSRAGGLLSPNLAQRVLFVGKAVRVLNRVTFGGKSGISSVNPNSSCLTEDELQTFSLKWKELGDAPTLCFMSLEAIVDSMHAVIASRLWDMLVHRYHLLHHLEAIRNYLLLGKGDLFHAFLIDSWDIFSKPPTPLGLVLLTRDWLSAAQACGIDDDDCFKRCLLALSVNGFSFEDFSSIEGFSLIGSASIFLEESAATILLCDGTTMSDPTPGGIWCDSKLQVEKGFETSFSFQYDEESTGTAKPPDRSDQTDDGNGVLKGRAIEGGISFVLQCLRSRTIGTGGEGMGSVGIPNSVAVCFNRCGALSFRSGGKVLATTKLGLSVTSCDNNDGGKRSSKQHNVVIKACPASSSVGDLDSSNVIFRIWLDSEMNTTPPTLCSPPVPLREVLKLSASGAYAGITASVCGAARICIKSWSWDTPAALSSTTTKEKPLAVANEEWMRIRIQYSIEWPLQLVLSRETVMEYGNIFSLLLLVKRVCVGLEKFWPGLMYVGRSADNEARQHLAPLLALRTSMAYFATNLNYYLQIDVIDAEFTLLKEAINTTRDFYGTLRAHSAFQSHVKKMTFVGVPALSISLHAPLVCANEMCRLLAANQNNILHVPMQAVVQLQQAFREDMKRLINVSEVVGAQQLALRINFNGYYNT